MSLAACDPWHQTPAAAPFDQSVLAGRKRPAPADDSNDSDRERFTKRFNLLNLGNNAGHGNSNYYLPRRSRPPSPAPSFTTTAHPTIDDTLMQVDDTRDRVFIHNLDEELAGMESDEEKLIFLPDIEKHLSRIPKRILTDRRDDTTGVEGHELVLYDLPKSLTVDESRDSVRKAISEARQRARQKADEEARQQDMNCKYAQGDRHGDVIETAHGYESGYVIGEVSEPEDDDPDVMDMD